MLVFPKAKINLGLRITGKRSDGYHDIETVLYPVNLCDALELVEIADSKWVAMDSLTLTGFELPGRKEDNIVLRAVRRLRENFPIPFLRIHLHKSIPSGAGLGGGSSDAAFLLRAVNRIFGLALNGDELKTIAAGLGSDCPFFIDCKPSFASGKGEILSPLGDLLAGCYAVLVNPRIPVSTMEAYKDCTPSKPDNHLQEIINHPVSEWKDLIVNDFEKTVFLIHPQIKEIKQILYSSGAIFSSMSGSGSTVYGIFYEKPEIPVNLRKNVIFEGILYPILATGK